MEATALELEADFGVGEGGDAVVVAPGEVVVAEVAGVVHVGRDSRMKHSSMKSSRGSWSRRYSSVASLMSWGCGCRGAAQVRQPVTAQARMPGVRAGVYRAGGVVLVSGISTVKGEEFDAVPDGGVHATDGGAAVAVDREFVGGDEVEKFVAQVASGEGVAVR